MTKLKFLVFFFGLSVFLSPMYSQVTIGTNKVPEKFSVLELISNDSLGLRLPLLTTYQRNELSDTYGSNSEMMGLTIFNVTNKCWETWNGLIWISLCAPPPTLTISRDTLIFTAATGGGGPQNVNVSTNQTGWVITRTVSWTTLSGEGTEVLTVSVPNTAYTGNVPLIDSIKIATTGGSEILSKTIVVIRLPEVSGIIDDTPSDIYVPYVGAFWRANQTGERLIRMTATAASAYAPWTATVIAGTDWITLDNVMTNDINYAYYPIGTPNELFVDSYENNPNFDSNHTVGGGIVVSGTSSANTPIYFRIGLKSRFSDSPKYSQNPDFNNTFPARYGVVQVSYGNPAKSIRIWIRQGEGADYLMRQGDPNGLNVAVADNRSYARRFSPYNLTDPGNGAPTDYLGTGGNILQVGGGDFVKYPSQAGYFFRWNFNRVAFHPVIPEPNIIISGWASNQYGVNLWNSATDETCPPTYRRPTDGDNTVQNLTGAVTKSEMRQSLWLNPPTGETPTPTLVADLANNVWGYYADGFFDRRAVVSANYSKNSTVSPSNSSVAYVGRLFFNKNNNASIFFPSAGYRANTTGALFSPGEWGYYWSSSSNSNGSNSNSGWNMRINSGYADQMSFDRSLGFSVRCVKQ